MEMEVPVEKNSGVKMFGFNRSDSGTEYGETPTANQTKSRSTGRRDHDNSDYGDGESEPKQRDSQRSSSQHRIPQMLKVAVVGESTVGKTAICEAFCRLNFTASTKYFMTCGVQIYGKTIKMSSMGKNKVGVDGEDNPSLRQLRPASSSVTTDERVNLILVDSSGKDVYTQYLPSYWEKLDAVALVVDLTNPTGLDNSMKYLEMAKNSMSRQRSEQQKVGVLIGNKMDLETQRGMSSSSVQNFAAEHNLEYFECSARSNFGLEEPFHFLAQEWFDRSQNTRDSVGSTIFRGRDRGDTDREQNGPRSSYQKRNT